MFCTKCGAMIINGERFCPSCGSEIKAASGARHNDGYERGDVDLNVFNVADIIYEEQYDQPDVKEEKYSLKKTRRTNAARALLLVAIIAFLIFAMIFISTNLDGCSCSESCGGEDNPAASVMMPDDGEMISQSDSSEEGVQEADAQSTTIAPTTVPTAAPTTVNQKAKEAEYIRQLLISKTWKTNMDGYNATITFKKDGTAVIKVKMFIGSINVDAQYKVTDDCHAVITAEYAGSNLGISGTITASSDKKLVVDRGSGKDKVILTA